MDHSATFARHFARLVSLLLHDAGNIDEQKVSLRALVTLSKNGPVSLAADERGLLANDQQVAAALTGVHDVATQLMAHSIPRVDFGAGAKAADLLGVARILASRATPGDGGAYATRKLTALNPKKITFVPPAPPAPSTARAAEAPTAPSSLSDAPTLLVPIDEGGARSARQAAALLAELGGVQDVSKLAPDDLLAALDATTDGDGATRVLDDLVVLAEHCVRTGKPVEVTRIFHGVVVRDAAVKGDAERKRAHVLAIRRLSKPAILRAVASLILKRPEGKQSYYEVLERAGEEGADAVIEQIGQASGADDRGALIDVCRELSDAVPALRRMLGDSRWFVVRNAADLLGELAAGAAESDLLGLLRHGDDRVRRAATNALLRLGTPQAIKGIYDAVGDTSPQVRMHATAAIATRRDHRTSTTLIRAIEDETDVDVQLAMIAALGKVATTDAVQKLIKMAEPEGRLFRKKATNFRMAAVQALGDAKTPAALTALKALAGDKEREIRDTASRALAQASR